MNKFSDVISLVFIVVLTGCRSVSLNQWPEGKDPMTVGLLVTNRFLDCPHNSFRPPQPPKSITYPEVCAWYGALKYAEVTGNNELSKLLEDRFLPFFGKEKHLVPRPYHVDYSVFGTIPLEMYLQTKDQKYFDMGIRFADAQWSIPSDSSQKVKEKYQTFLDKGLTWQTRYWIDDMFMITMVQSKAYEATQNAEYINRAAHEMVVYLDTLQRDNGLFYHSPDAPFFWGRGNGWMAAGMTELLNNLPPTNADRATIMDSYLKMMESLRHYQRDNGLWGQLIDSQEAWDETSSSAMFTYAMIMGVKKGWLKKSIYTPVARKAWLGLLTYLNAQGDISNVCEGTNRKNDYQYYLDRKSKTGDMHGQAPLLWCAWALLQNE